MTAQQPVKFYQTGTFTVGNRLLAEDDRNVQANMRRTNSLNSGHRACQGCGEALGARYAIDAAMQATNNQVMAVNATGCRRGRAARVRCHWATGRMACLSTRLARNISIPSARRTPDP